MIIGRFIQGIGAGAGASLWRTIFKDTFNADQIAKYIPILGIALTFVIPAAPALGAFLQEQFGWRSIFLFLMLYGVAALLYVQCFFKESNASMAREKLSLVYARSSFRELLTSRIFMGYSVCVFLSYGAFFSWMVLGPIIMIKNMGMTSSDFGLLTFFGCGSAMGIAGYVNGKLTPKFGIPFTLQLGWGVMLSAGIIVMLGSLYLPQNIYVITIAIVLFYFGVTFIWPGVFTGAFAHFGHIAGYAGSLYSFMQIGGAGLIGYLIAYLPDTDETPLGCVFIIIPIVAWTFYTFVVRPAEEEAIK